LAVKIGDHLLKKLLITVILLPVLSGAGLAAQDAIDLSGNWEIHSSVGGATPITVNCVLEQQGNELAGTCTPVMENPEPAMLTGEVNGSTANSTTANWQYGVFFNGNAGTVEFQADVITQNGMLGTLILSGTPAPFSALKR
jgi:hypothetical protein